MPLLNYTTSVSAERTIAEISALLAGRVARLSTLYAEDGTADGLEFQVRTPHGPRTFHLPVNVAAVHALLQDTTRGPAYRSWKQAERVAWRILRDWVAAQMALIEVGMAALDQLMLPYLVVGGEGETLYEAYRAREQAALEVGRG